MEDATFRFAGAGTTMAVAAWRLRGDGSGPPAHLQAGVHADEIPGMLVLHRLLPRLAAAEAAGRLRGDITVVPQANPVGQRQFRHARLLGRFDQASGQNFNRGFTDAARDPSPGVAAWQAGLLALARPADIVLDLHTDDEALPYAYLSAGFWPQAADLVAALGSAVAILWDGDAGTSFEDGVVLPWIARGGLDGRLASTVELRGQADVDPGTAQADADGLYRLLCHRGVIDEAVALPEWHGVTVPIAHVQTIRAPADGVLAFTRGLGEQVAAGEPFALLVACPGDPASEQPIVAAQDGILVTRTRDRFCARGGVVAKLTGSAPSPGWGGGALDD